jgi:hypothetical protein
MIQADALEPSPSPRLRRRYELELEPLDPQFHELRLDDERLEERPKEPPPLRRDPPPEKLRRDELRPKPPPPPLRPPLTLRFAMATGYAPPLIGRRGSWSRPRSRGRAP